jgi:hypothetical protein
MHSGSVGFNGVKVTYTFKSALVKLQIMLIFVTGVDADNITNEEIEDEVNI